MANWVGYDFKVGDRIVHSGITQDPTRRESEHKQRWANGRLVIIRRGMTEAQARAWEATKKKTITPERK
jgi:predicted GIY-YIG superfamily endonuclease